MNNKGNIGSLLGSSSELTSSRRMDFPNTSAMSSKPRPIPTLDKNPPTVSFTVTTAVTGMVLLPEVAPTTGSLLVLDEAKIRPPPAVLRPRRRAGTGRRGSTGCPSPNMEDAVRSAGWCLAWCSWGFNMLFARIVLGLELICLIAWWERMEERLCYL